MRPENWPTKHLYYQILSRDLENIFGSVALASRQDYVQRYIDLGKVLSDTGGVKNAQSQEENRKARAAFMAMQDLPIEILQKFTDGEQILTSILDKREYQIDFILAQCIVTDKDIVVRPSTQEKAISVLRNYVGNPQGEYDAKTQMLLDELDGKYKRLSEDFRQTLRVFGYYLFNGTLDWEILCEPTDTNYVNQLALHPWLFGQSCCIYFNHLQREAEDPAKRCAQWIRKQIDPSYEVNPPFEEWELDLSCADPSYWGDLKRMVLEIGEHRFQPSLLKGEYVSEMVGCAAGFLEMTFAIWSNAVKVDQEYKVININEVEHRVAQWIKANIDPSYTIAPPLQEWETELL